jgi:hypothetical protein
VRSTYDGSHGGNTKEVIALREHRSWLESEAQFK